MGRIVKPGAWDISSGHLSPMWQRLWEKRLFVVPLWEGGGVPRELADSNAVATLVNAPPWQLAQHGRYLRLGDNNNDRRVSWGTTTKWQARLDAPPWTACALFRWTRDDNDEATFLSKYGSTASVQQFRWQVSNETPPGDLLPLFAAGSTIYGASEIIVPGEWYLAFVRTYGDGDAFRQVVFDANGGMLDDSGKITGALDSSATTGDLAFGRAVFGGDDATLDLAFVWIIEMGLPLKAMIDLSRDMFGMFQREPWSPILAPRIATLTGSVVPTVTEAEVVSGA